MLGAVRAYAEVMLPRRIMLFLDIFVGALIALGILQILILVDGAPSGLIAASVGAHVVCALAWALWRRRGHTVWLIILAFGSLLADTGTTASMLVCLALAMLVAVSMRVALAVLAGLVAVVLVVNIVLTDRTGPTLLLEQVSAVVMFGLGIVLGLALTALQAERRRNAALVDEVRRSAGAEQELMLAEERARSARELHDGLGHELTLIQLSLEYAERMRIKDPEKAFEEVGRAQATAREALAYMRRWVRALNPPREANLSGTAAFDAIAASFRGTGLEIEVREHGQERELGKEASLFAYRMVQEGLTNVLRHSGAERVVLDVEWLGEEIRLRLRDFGGAGAALEPGFGLRSLSERAEELGGSFAAEVREDGVELVGTVPVGRAAESARGGKVRGGRAGSEKAVRA